MKRSSQAYLRMAAAELKTVIIDIMHFVSFRLVFMVSLWEMTFKEKRVKNITHSYSTIPYTAEYL